MLGRSFRLGTFAGIPLKLHWTFGLTFLFVLFIGLKYKRDYSEIGVIFLLLIVMFFCVILHEYGHALMAKRFKVKTIDIILSPIGGLARLEKLPSKPIHEFYIAVAGPLVNGFISILLASILYLASKPIFLNFNGDLNQVDNWGAYLSLILGMNLILFIFNLVPAFPMDGGRILRSLLSIKLGKKKSTFISSFIGYLFAIAFILFGIFSGRYILAIIGVFVIIMARGEMSSARQEDFLFNNYINRPDLLNKLEFRETSLMQELIDCYLAKKGNNFMIFSDDEKLVGIVKEAEVKQAIKDNKFNAPAIEYMSFTYATSNMSNLQTALVSMNQEKIDFIVFIDDEGKPSIIEEYRIIEKMMTL